MSELDDLQRRIAVLERRIAESDGDDDETQLFITDFTNDLPMEVFAVLLRHLEKTVPGFSIPSFLSDAETSLLKPYNLLDRSGIAGAMERRTKWVMMQMIPGAEYDLKT